VTAAAGWSELEEDLRALLTLLEREQTCLRGPAPSSLADIVDEKSRLLAAISQRPLPRELQDANPPPAARALAELARRCNRLNEENRTLANQRIKVVGLSSRVLKSAIRRGSADLYNASGRSEQGAVRRSLGDA
jgi:flagellar biosynthesis/type III secretory pathway chaperone